MRSTCTHTLLTTFKWRLVGGARAEATTTYPSSEAGRHFHIIRAQSPQSRVRQSKRQINENVCPWAVVKLTAFCISFGCASARWLMICGHCMSWSLAALALVVVVVFICRSRIIRRRFSLFNPSSCGGLCFCGCCMGAVCPVIETDQKAIFVWTFAILIEWRWRDARWSGLEWDEPARQAARHPSSEAFSCGNTHLPWAVV